MSKHLELLKNGHLKHLSLLLFAAAVTTGCKKDDDKKAPTPTFAKDEIQGFWGYYNIENPDKPRVNTIYIHDDKVDFYNSEMNPTCDKDRSFTYDDRNTALIAATENCPQLELTIEKIETSESAGFYSFEAPQSYTSMEITMNKSEKLRATKYVNQDISTMLMRTKVVSENISDDLQIYFIAPPDEESVSTAINEYQEKIIPMTFNVAALQNSTDVKTIYLVDGVNAVDIATPVSSYDIVCTIELDDFNGPLDEPQAMSLVKFESWTMVKKDNFYEHTLKVTAEDLKDLEDILTPEEKARILNSVNQSSRTTKDFPSNSAKLTFTNGITIDCEKTVTKGILTADELISNLSPIVTISQ